MKKLALVLLAITIAFVTVYFISVPTKDYILDVSHVTSDPLVCLRLVCIE